MSRIGKLPIAVESNVKVSLDRRTVSVQGPKGTLSQPLPRGITAVLEEGQLSVRRKDDSKEQKALHGLTRSLLQNAVTGVTKGFAKDLEIQGVGYRAQVAGAAVTFNIGFTHPIEFPIPDGVQISVERQTKITVAGIDRQKVGHVAARIRALRPPDVYKGKGIRYADEIVRKKAGKAGAK